MATRKGSGRRPRQGPPKPSPPRERAASWNPRQAAAALFAPVWQALIRTPAPGPRLWHYLLIAVIPAVLTLLNRNWLFENGPHMDPWYYFGHLLHYPHFHNMIPEYPGERIIWISVGYLFTHLLGHLPGLITLHILVVLATLFTLYCLLVRIVDAPTALLTTVALGCNSYFIGPNGWDFPEGLMFLFLLLSLALIVSDHGSKEWLFLLLSGMAWAALLYTYVAWTALTPAYFYAVVRIVRRSGSYLRTAVRVACWTGLGWLATSVSCAGIYALMGGRGFFFRRNIDQALHIGVRLKVSPWVDPDWMHKCTWLIFPILAFLMASAALWPRFHQKTGQRALLAFHLLASAAMVWMTFRPVRILAFDYHASILVPGVFLVFALLLFRVPSGATRLEWWALMATTATLSLAPLGSRFLANHAPPAIVVVLAAFVILLLACFSLFRPGKRSVWAAMVLLFAGASYALTPPATTTAWFYSYKGYDMSERVSMALKLIGDRIPANTYPAFWIDARELRSPLASEFRAIMCAFFAQSRSMWLFPVVDRVYQPGTRLFLLSEQQDITAGPDYNLARKGMPTRVLSQDRLRYGGVSYWVTQLEVLPPTPANIRGPFVKQDIQLHLERPTVLPSPGIYQFELSGLPAGSDIHFGALQADGRTWLEESGPAIDENGQSIRWLRLAVSAGEPVQLAVRSSGGESLAKSAGLKLSVLRDSDSTHTVREFNHWVSRPFGNLLQNAGFEDKVADWNWTHGVLRTATNCYQGDCTEFVGSGDGQVVTEQIPSELTSGKQYEFSGWLRAGKSSQPCSVGVWNPSGSQWIARQTLTPQNDWTHFQVRFTAQTADSVFPRLEIMGAARTSILLDEFVIREAAGPK
jgi:hypothetical protein